MLVALSSVPVTTDTIPSVLFAVPGTVGSQATILDGHLPWPGRVKPDGLYAPPILLLLGASSRRHPRIAHSRAETLVFAGSRPGLFPWHHGISDVWPS